MFLQKKILNITHKREVFGHMSLFWSWKLFDIYVPLKTIQGTLVCFILKVLYENHVKQYKEELWNPNTCGYTVL